MIHKTEAILVLDFEPSFETFNFFLEHETTPSLNSSFLPRILNYILKIRVRNPNVDEAKGARAPVSYIGVKDDSTVIRH